MIIYGTRNYFRTQSVTQHGFCTACSRLSKLRSYYASPFVHLYFIPLIPIGVRTRIHKMCDKCSQGQSIEPTAFDSIIARFKDQSADAIIALKSGDVNFQPDDASEQTIDCVEFLHSVMDWLYASNNIAFCEGMLSQLSEPECRYAQFMLQSTLETFRGKVDNAIQSYEQASQKNPQSYQAHHQRGQLLVARKRVREAIEAYEAAITRATAQQQYQLNLELVDIQTAAKMYTEAAARFDGLIATNPELLNNAAFMKLVNKNKKKAGIKFATKASG